MIWLHYDADAIYNRCFLHGFKISFATANLIADLVRGA
jgi:hypothetical protein